ncbi:proton-conducting transporter transmembrane domain-containing protein [Wolbachia endosymbiont of Howardula sp.]|uniref:proton-conducting transporter transmembrane domain-containing protein n=1 Tax=Wolbachia endosymbiont of Howardula sp. TaxID=2916816 RepID=UPI00217E90BC|nr:proton-conducting transporter membrane subunit [Wolbachia endosymbiont of Howardula sp.]UWI83015.1 cation:proton antiporter [Wolbachia endosymbiont of Howardula sp.]
MTSWHSFVVLTLSSLFSVGDYLLITPIIPIVSALLILGTSKCSSMGNRITILSSILMFIYICITTLFWLNSNHSQFILMDFGSNLHISFKLEFIGITFSLLVSFLWILTSIYTVSYMQYNYQYNANFLCLFLIAISCTILIAFSGDLLTTFIFYEILTISTYPLVTYHLTNESIIAGRYYLRILFFGSLVFFLPAIGLIYNKYHTLDFTSNSIITYDPTIITFVSVLFLMLIYGIGKTTIMPMHLWLLKAMVAPMPVSALLHAVAVVKSGIIIIIKIIVYIFGVYNMKCFMQHNWFIGGWLSYFSGITVIIASLIALKQRELKKMLAYSTISQLSYIILFASIFDDKNIKIAVFQLVSHAFAKITLFFVTGNIFINTGEKYIDKMHGIGRAMPVNMIAFTIGALSMIGIPPAPTFWSKFFMLQSVFDSNNIILCIFFALVMIISTILNSMYFLPIIYNMFFCSISTPYVQHNKLSIFLVIPPVITAICTLVIFVNYQLVFNSMYIM